MANSSIRCRQPRRPPDRDAARLSSPSDRKGAARRDPFAVVVRLVNSARRIAELAYSPGRPLLAKESPGGFCVMAVDGDPAPV
jgi:hypothetical protein